MTICPCCGFKFHGDLIRGCKQCGAHAVGEALPKPAYELPSYGRSLVLVVSGTLIVFVFAVETILAMVHRSSGSLSRLFGFWSWVGAAETAAWRLKWISIPVLFVALWFGRKLYRSMTVDPSRFCGIKYARRGLLATAVVGLLIALLIGITVPARLRQRQLSVEAGNYAQAYTLQVAFLQYQQKYKKLPDQMTVKEDLASLPDPYGSIAEALRNFDPNGYQPRAEVAAMGPQKGRGLRSSIIRKVSMNSATDDATPSGLSFTDYDLRLPGEDKIFGTDDDWIEHDGVIQRLSDVAKGGLGRSVSTGILKP